ncbi:MAG: hypothetical protein NC929_03940 [Candidatus Omnitrophica bacterium]|nr:hypothetical protein [Candidatus Omnitrophota bacterium]
MFCSHFYYNIKRKDFPKTDFLDWLREGLVSKSYVNPLVGLLRKAVQEKNLKKNNKITYYAKLNKLHNSLITILSIGLNSIDTLNNFISKKVITSNLKVAQTGNLPSEQKKDISEFEKKLKETIGSLVLLVEQAIDIEYAQVVTVQNKLKTILSELFNHISPDQIKYTQSYGGVIHSYIQSMFAKIIDSSPFNTLKEVDLNLRKKLDHLSTIISSVIEEIEQKLREPLYGLPEAIDPVNVKSQIRDIIDGAKRQRDTLYKSYTEAANEYKKLDSELTDLKNSINSLVGSNVFILSPK